MPDTEKIRVALADDTNLVRIGFASLINKFEDCEVILQVQEGRELIPELSRCERLPDICIIESNERIVDGYKTLTDLQMEYPEVKLLVLSTYNLEYTVIKMIQHGICGYLLKSCSIDELHLAIRSIYTDGHHYSRIAPQTLFEQARSNAIPELTEEDMLLFDSVISLLNGGDVNAFIAGQTSGDRYQLVIEKMNLDGRLGLVIYLMQTGRIPQRHIYNAQNKMLA